MVLGVHLRERGCRVVFPVAILHDVERLRHITPVITGALYGQSVAAFFFHLVHLLSLAVEDLECEVPVLHQFGPAVVVCIHLEAFFIEGIIIPAGIVDKPIGIINDGIADIDRCPYTLYGYEHCKQQHHFSACHKSGEYSICFHFVGYVYIDMFLCKK